MFEQTCCTVDQFINCAAFDELCNIWLIMQHTINMVRVRGWIRVRAMVWVSFRVRVMLTLGLVLYNWPNAQRVWSNTNSDHIRLTVTALLCDQTGK